MSEQETSDARLVDRAAVHIQEGELKEASRLLLDVASRAPSDYRHSYEEGDKLCIKFWSLAEFLEYVSWMKTAGRERSVAWLANAYPRAFYHLGYLLLDAGDPARAIAFLDRGLQLEPSSAKLASEKAQALIRLGRHKEAKAIYEGLLAAEGFVSVHDRAAALRGKGFILIEEGDLPAAEATFQQSLELDPDSKMARQELEYINQLRTRARRRT
jgi:tetratricopeptide (TPR) repeat protein